MFFMFYILVFTIYFCDKSSTARKEVNLKHPDYFEANAEDFDLQHNNKDDVEYKNRDLTTGKSLSLNIQNLTQNHNNLKSNAFDKMLSDEMLSIRQRFFEKDLAYTSIVQKLTKSNAATPTLEVKQKWPVVDSFTTNLDTDLRDDGAPQIESYEIKSKNFKMGEPKIKSLDVRSLYGHSGNSMHSAEMKCNCANANANHQCKHGDDCTRKTPHGSAIGNSPYPAFYMPYQAYFVTDIDENLLNELSIPKTTKHRKPSNPRYDDLYYEDDWKKRRTPKDDDEIVMNIDYEVENNKKTGCIHEDLKEVYNRGVKRKCYCSVSQSTRSRTIVIFMSVFVSLGRTFRFSLLSLKYKD